MKKLLVKNLLVKSLLTKKLVIKKLVIICLYIIMSLLIRSEETYAEEIFNYDDAQKIVDEYTSSEFSISETIDSLKNGDGTGWIKKVIVLLKDNLMKEIIFNKEALVKIIFIAIGAAILTNFSAAFGSEGASETGVMMSYIILIGYLFAGFSVIYEVTEETIGNISIFMETMIPAYFISMGITGAIASASTLYEITLFIITMMCKVMETLVIPAIMIYVVLMIVNNIQSKNYLSKFGELVKTIILWSLKSMFAGVVGINVIQSVILPSVDAVTGKAATKVVNLIPGIGNSAGTVADVIVGSGLVIKNAIGTTIVIGLILICAVPVLKIFVYVAMYKLAGALIEPVSDGRIVESIDAVTEGGRLLLKTTIYAVSLFAVSIAIVCIATG